MKQALRNGIAKDIYKANLKKAGKKQMREIKFRAWDKNERKWHTRVQFGTNCCHSVYDESREGWFEFDEHCGEVVQYTGLKDRNGKDIYEGDLYENNHGRYIVKFARGTFYLHDSDYDDVESEEHMDLYLTLTLEGYIGQVIGNIYESKEVEVNAEY